MATKREIMRDIPNVETSRIIANNTVEYTRTNGERVIRLHQTDIVTIAPNGDVVLNTNGYRTQTTKARINDAITPNVYQTRGNWYVGDVPFTDGMKLPGGKLPRITAAAKRAERVADRLAKRIARFVNQIDDLETMPVPNNGDCWLCLMFEKMPQGDFTQEAGGRIANPGYKVNDTSHLRAHITVKENYLHGTLIQNAYLWAGHSMFSWDWDRQRWDRSAKQTAKRNLRRYLKAQLGIAG